MDANIAAGALKGALGDVIKEAVAEEEGVLVLNDDNFDAALKQHAPLLVEFYAPWCGHCKALAPAYALAAANLATDGMRIAKVDGTAAPKLSARFEIKSYPTIKWFDTPSAAGEDYAGDRSKRGVIKFVREKHGKAEPVVWPVATLAEAEAFAAQYQAFAVAFVAEPDSDFDEALLEAAPKLTELEVPTVRIMADAPEAAALRARFFGEGAGEAFGVETHFGGKHAFAVLPEGEDRTESGALKDFAVAAALPAVANFGPEMSGLIFANSIKTHVLLFADPKGRGVKKIRADFAAAAEAERARDKPRAIFVFVDPAANQGVLDYFAIASSDLPKVALSSMPEGKAARKFIMPSEGKGGIDRAAIATFLDGFVAGELKATLKSAAEPEGDRVPAEFGDITVVTGSSFARIALDKDKDVLLEVFAPWCGHCKNLFPTYKALAGNLSGIGSLVIANMDGTANEIEYEGIEVKGYPTLAFFPASPDGSKKVARYYDGGSGDVASFASWLHKNAVVKFELPAAVAAAAAAVKSEPEPTAEEAAASAVVTAVGTTVDAIALDAERDVMLEFYAPWCGHCKALAPVYEALATDLKGREGFEKVTLAKLDATANDYSLSGVKVEGFPTLYFFPAGAKAEPVLYSGARDAAALEAFLRKEGSTTPKEAAAADAAEGGDDL